jgi:hypothetical protein
VVHQARITSSIEEEGGGGTPFDGPLPVGANELERGGVKPRHPNAPLAQRRRWVKNSLGRNLETFARTRRTGGALWRAHPPR